MKNENFQVFFSLYAIELMEAHKQDPDRFNWPVDELHHLLDQAKNQLVAGTYSKSCPVLLATYRRLAAKHKKESQFVM